MSTNCIRCVVNKRTGPDLLCDCCREAAAAPQPSMQPPPAPDLAVTYTVEFDRDVGPNTILKLAEVFGLKTSSVGDAINFLEQMHINCIPW